LIVANLPNADMVGHSGCWEPTIEAIETIDKCLGEIIAAVDQCGANLIITADHGNAEMLYCDTHEKAHTAHTTNPVPLLYYGDLDLKLKASGDLTNIAATVLELMGLDGSPAMSDSLFV